MFQEKPTSQQKKQQVSHEQKNHLRNHYITQFLRIKQCNPTIPREILFLGLAIFDYYIASVHNPAILTHRKEQRSKSYIIACLMISFKFASNYKITLKGLEKHFHVTYNTLQQIIDIQADILQTINYQIPIDHTYAAMVRSFKKRDMETEKEIDLATRCLTFYRQAIRLSSDFVLCSDLGSQILLCLAEKRARDRRICWACSQINKKKEKQRKVVLGA